MEGHQAGYVAGEVLARGGCAAVGSGLAVALNSTCINSVFFSFGLIFSLYSLLGVRRWC